MVCCSWRDNGGAQGKYPFAAGFSHLSLTLSSRAMMVFSMSGPFPPAASGTPVTTTAAASTGRSVTGGCVRWSGGALWAPMVSCEVSSGTVIHGEKCAYRCGVQGWSLLGDTPLWWRCLPLGRCEVWRRSCPPLGDACLWDRFLLDSESLSEFLALVGECSEPLGSGSVRWPWFQRLVSLDMYTLRLILA